MTRRTARSSCPADATATASDCPAARYQGDTPSRGARRSLASAQRSAAGGTRLAVVAARGRTPCGLRADLPRAPHPVLERAELLDPHRAPGVNAAGGNTDLGTKTEFAAISE